MKNFFVLLFTIGLLSFAVSAYSDEGHDKKLLKDFNPWPEEYPADEATEYATYRRGDLAGGNAQRNLFLFYIRTTASEGRLIVLDTGTTPSPAVVTSLDYYPTGIYPRLFLRDLNGDQRPELFLSVALNSRTGSTAFQFIGETFRPLMPDTNGDKWIAATSDWRAPDPNGDYLPIIGNIDNDRWQALISQNVRDDVSLYSVYRFNSLRNFYLPWFKARCPMRGAPDSSSGSIPASGLIIDCVRQQKPDK